MNSSVVGAAVSMPLGSSNGSMLRVATGPSRARHEALGTAGSKQLGRFYTGLYEEFGSMEP